MNKKFTRKQFLLNSGKAAVGVTAVAGLSSIVTAANTKAAGVATWPWPYNTLDPDEVRVQAHYLYYNGRACCAGVFGSLVNAQAAVQPDPWANMPLEIMQFGGGGGAGWGTLCGTLNGAAAFINLVTESPYTNQLITELWGWYTQEELPTDTANDFATNGDYLVHNYDDVLPQNISGSVLCHVSVTEWCITANKKVSDTERKERCARIAGDIAAKAAELLNAHFAGTFTPTYTDPDTVTECLSCHGSALLYNVMTRMDCVPCHGDPHAPSAVDKILPLATKFKLDQNYPNPFNPTTTIRFSVPHAENVSLQIYDMRGALIKTLVNHEVYQQGTYEVRWDGKDNLGVKVASGIYFAKMAAGKFMQTRKMSLVK